MTDVLSGSIGIELEDQRVRRLRQRGVERVPESGWKRWRTSVGVGRDADYPEECIRRGVRRILAE